MTQIQMARSSTAGLRARFHLIADRLEALLPQSLLLLTARIGVGMVFFRSGLLKTDNWSLTLLLFRNEYKVPLLPNETAALLATAIELSMPVLLFIGLAARPATLPLIGMILVIQIFVYPNAWSDHLMWATLLVLILTRGPGAWSLDCLLGLERSRR
jgi:putative oxidoreductase